VEPIGRRHREVSLGLRICVARCWGLWSLFTPPAKAQNSRGTILGHVQDASPAPVAGAKVTVSNVDTGVLNKFTTAAAGDYVFVNLVPGTYSISIEKDGFKGATSCQLSALWD
jgi:Carboxypeptidase regulatory-like domain